MYSFNCSSVFVSTLFYLFLHRLLKMKKLVELAVPLATCFLMKEQVISVFHYMCICYVHVITKSCCNLGICVNVLFS